METKTVLIGDNELSRQNLNARATSVRGES